MWMGYNRVTRSRKKRFPPECVLHLTSAPGAVRWLQNKFRLGAVVGEFGDEFEEVHAGAALGAAEEERDGVGGLVGFEPCDDFIERADGGFAGVDSAGRAGASAGGGAVPGAVLR